MLRGAIIHRRRIEVLARHAACAASFSSDSEEVRGKVCLVVGAGSGIGAAVARKFAAEGYVTAIVRRSDTEKLHKLRDSIRQSAGECHAFQIDATKEGSLQGLVQEIESSIGPIACAVYNLGAQLGSRDIERTTPKLFERAMRLGAFGAYELARSLAGPMTKRGSGTIIFTGATAGLRGNAGQHAHAAGMFARRALAQSLGHELGAHGIHIAHVVVDGMVDSPDTLGKMMPELFQNLKKEKMPLQGIIMPKDVADAMFYLHGQPRSSWTSEMDLRPWQDTAWYNTS